MFLKYCYSTCIVCAQNLFEKLIIMWKLTQTTWVISKYPILHDIRTCTCKYIHVQYRSDARFKACVIYTRLHEEANALVLYTEVNTCLYTYIVKSVYTRRQTPSHEKAHTQILPYIYLASDLYCTCIYIHMYVFTR